MGTAGLHGANVTGLTPQEISKWWIVSGSLNSFYDDNTFNSPSSQAKGSLGTEVKPGVTINLPGSRTLFSASYDFTLNYYEARPTQKIDQSHFFDGRLNHKFSERYDIDFTETFIISDEPAVIGKNSATTVFGRQDASSTRSQFVANFSALITSVHSLVVGYKNDYQDYDSDSYSFTLDRARHSFHTDLRWLHSERTLFHAGYEVGHEDYFAPGFIEVRVFPPRGEVPLERTIRIYPSIKNKLSHDFYLGAKHTLSRQLEANWQAGFQFIDYYNSGEAGVSPNLDANFNYTYSRGSTLRLGANVGKYPSDAAVTSRNVTLDQTAMNIGLSVAHRISARLTGSAQLQYQHAIFNGGVEGIDGRADDYYSFSLGVDYKIRESLWANIGYSHTRLVSGRAFAELIDFSRNRIFMGVRASY